MTHKYLDKSATEKVFNSIVTSSLDNDNPLLYSLQRLQNTALRIVTLSRKSCSQNLSYMSQVFKD